MASYYFQADSKNYCFNLTSTAVLGFTFVIADEFQLDDLVYDQKSMLSLVSFCYFEYPPKTSASSDYWHPQIKQRSIDSDGLLESQYFIVKGLSVGIIASSIS